MRDSNRKIMLLTMLVLLLGCIGEVPVEPPKKGFYENKPVVFKSSYDEVWEATTRAIKELNWDTKAVDREKGIVEFMTSYVYNPSFNEYSRVYVEPSNDDIKNSRVKPYLRRISHYEKLTPPPAPPNPKFVKEKLKIKLKPVNTSETELQIDYRIMPYYDYKIGYLGTVKSNGYLEKKITSRIQEILTEKELIPPPPPLPTEQEYRLMDVFFDFDKYYIRPDAEPVLIENANVLKENPAINIVIEGYADTRGPTEYNLWLGQKRAEAVKEYLVNLGIEPFRITTISRGETSQFASGTTEEAYQLNRRVRFIPIRVYREPGL
ncbi:MAG: hypothetical protein KatS3mg078_1977 [Deltaproteobacteria bacterium]|nr:MAG: hypothetical protein KatS3mg078_1977 [Deltaproteobacteria bacterium]